MRDINIQVKENHTVDFENDYAGLNRENLQGNIIFNFDKFISGQARVEIVINNVSGYINLDQVEQTYILPIKSSLLTGNDILMQLVIDEPATYNLTTDTDIDTKKIYYEKVGDNYVQVEHPRKADLGNYYEASIPVWKSETFYLKVGFSINAEETIPEQYPSWIETLNNLINETESAIEQASNVNISATQTQSGATITITNKDGESNSVNITNGADGTDGKDAKINGYNTITIQEGTNIGIEQNGEILTINNTYDDTSIKNDITTLQNTKANKSELSVYSLITETGAKIDLEINSTTYVLTAKLYDKNNVLLSTSTGIDLPLETMVVGASYDSETKEIVLTLKNGQTVRFSVADLVSGLQTEITSDNKLASDLVDDTNQTHKFVSASEKTQITTNATNITSLQNNKEDKSNKVTSISSSSTDTQYPSAKCMYDSQTLQDNEISDLKSENDYLNSIINQLPKVSSQGTILTLNNTINGRMNIELGTSELEQETTTGKQLLKPYIQTETKNSVTITNNGDGTYTINGTPSANTYFAFPANKFEDFGEAGTYYFSSNTFSNLTYASYIDSSTLLFWKTTNGTFALTDTVQSFRFQIGVEGGVTYNNVVVKPMINKGSTAEPFEKYTGGIPAPNPSFPMPVHTISGSNKIIVSGKNRFNYNDLASKIQTFTISGSAESFTVTGYGTYQYPISISTNEIISGSWSTTNLNGDVKAIYEDDTNENIFSSYSSSTASGNINFTPSKNIKALQFRTFNSNNNITLNNFMISKDGGDYEPYVFQEANIDLGDIEYCEIGDYKDEFIRDNEGNWGIRKNIGKVVLDGSENWSKTGDTNVSVFTTAISGRNTSLSSSSMSDYFKYQFANNVGAFYFGSASYDTCAFCMENTYTIETFKTWLGTHNVSVYIILATPTYTPITGDLAEQLENIYQGLKSYAGTTNISQVNNDLPFNISANALLDLNTLVGE